MNGKPPNCFAGERGIVSQLTVTQAVKARARVASASGGLIKSKAIHWVRQLLCSCLEIQWKQGITGHVLTHRPATASRVSSLQRTWNKGRPCSNIDVQYFSIIYQEKLEWKIEKRAKNSVGRISSFDS